MTPAKPFSVNSAAAKTRFLVASPDLSANALARSVDGVACALHIERIPSSMFWTLMDTDSHHQAPDCPLKKPAGPPPGAALRLSVSAAYSQYPFARFFGCSRSRGAVRWVRNHRIGPGGDLGGAPIPPFGLSAAGPLRVHRRLIAGLDIAANANNIRSLRKDVSGFNQRYEPARSKH